ncbi:hypothetical protein SPD48_08055 [Pseudogracilibacillus sp. SE30717A]|uniref:hypothetical protein n=1 Tax=Pseudogracilibacillus sp. SE30717A TaxID=3098293 RepID=UPI00300DCBB3
MEVFAALIPMVIIFGIYIVILGLCAWVVILFYKKQKERNEILSKIAAELKAQRIDRKVE